MKTKRFALPWHGWVFGILLLLFGLFSAYDYVMSMLYGEVFYKVSGMTDSQVTYYSNFPIWATVAWSLSVWGMLVAAITLLLRYKITILLFSISLVGTLCYILYIFALSNGKEAMGALWAAPLVVAISIAAIIYYCKRLARAKVLI